MRVSNGGQRKKDFVSVVHRPVQHVEVCLNFVAPAHKVWSKAIKFSIYTESITNSNSAAILSSPHLGLESVDALSVGPGGREDDGDVAEAAEAAGHVEELLRGGRDEVLQGRKKGEGNLDKIRDKIYSAT